MLVDGKKLHAGLVQQNVLGAIAMMHVEVKNADAFRTGGTGFERGDGDVVEVAEAHGFFAQRMVAGRAHEAENRFALARSRERVQRGGDRRAGVSANVLEIRRVLIERLRHGEPREDCRRVGAENDFVGDAGGLGEIKRQFRLVFQQGDGVFDARRAFGIARLAVAGAAFVGDDFHAGI